MKFFNFLFKKPVFIALFSCLHLVSALILIYSLFRESDFFYIGLACHFGIFVYSVIKADTQNIKGLMILLGVHIVVFAVSIVSLFWGNINIGTVSIELIYFIINFISFLYMIIIISLQNIGITLKKQALICILIPILIMAVTSLLIFGNAMRISEVLFTTAIILICLFAFFALRLIITFVRTRRTINDKKLKMGSRISLVIFTIILPVFGLYLNNSEPFLGSDYMFGDFTNIWFYILAVFNGIIILIESNDRRISLLLLFLKGIGFSYITYFAVIFCQYIPIGVIGIIFFGLGLLVFLPAMIFLAELFQIIKNIKAIGNNQMSISLVILGFLVIPAVMSYSFYLDRENFNIALAYTESSNSYMPAVNIKKVERTLAHLTAKREFNRVAFSETDSIPFITRMYDNIALENKLVSNDTLNKMLTIFLDEKAAFENTMSTNTFELSEVTTDTEYDEKSGAYKTWINMSVTNKQSFTFQEYRTSFYLPEGCVIKDYYLYVGAQQKFGILTDKRAALTNYENIIRTPRDPGIIYYENDNLIALRVYPFGANETRKTGFLVMHSQSEKIIIDGVEIELKAENPISEPVNMTGFHFIPASYKQNLPESTRTPRYYFLIDSSKDSPVPKHIEKAKGFVAKNQIENYEMYSVSYRMLPYDENHIINEAGFNMGYAISEIYNKTKSGEFPVIIAVSDRMDKAAFQNRSNKRYPESQYYYNLEDNFFITPYSFIDNSTSAPMDMPIISKAHIYTYKVIPESGNTIISEKNGYVGNEYFDSLILQLSCRESNSDFEQIAYVKEAFEKRILTKYTAFTVLETKEQEQTLLDLQEKFLNAEKNSDAPAVMMSEPDTVWILIIVLFMRMLKKKKGI